MDVAELWRFLLENPPYLLITVGFGILTFWLVNSVANIVVDPTKKEGNALLIFILFDNWICVAFASSFFGYNTSK